ncbi:MAG: ADP-ribose pyrophosphatase [Thermomicrobiales bacterium]|jgi:ADP-ribose pyrophosphatase|nr:ADP-ribose pyrophosphatase [Thermomicrobiales bacterium]
MPSDPPSEVTIGSRDGYAGKFLRVRVDEVRLPSGRTSTREVVDHPGAVAILAVTDDGDLLLVRQYRHAAGRALLELPAGTREPDEPPAETVRRELIEETGHAPGSITELVTFFPTPGYSSEQIILFRADDCTPVQHDRDADEPALLVRVPLADVPSLLAPGPNQIADGKTLIGLLWLLRDVTDERITP